MAIDRQKRQERIDSLFVAASELRPELREDYLRAECGDDDLLAEVEGLLKANEQLERRDDSFLNPLSVNIKGLLNGSELFKDEDLPAFESDRFSIVRCLGRGGMGVVFEAIDLVRNMRVALKTMRAVEPSALDRFKQEFRSLEGLVHSNLVPLYEFFSDGREWYFTMELIEDGVDFLTFVRSSTPRTSAAGLATTVVWQETPRNCNPLCASAPSSDDGRPAAPNCLPSVKSLDFQRIRAAFRQLATGVCFLHGAGKLHRDLKPGNVMVRKNGQVILLDFGLVVDQSNRPNATLPNGARGEDFAGTVAYMAPEQAASQPLTEASDWYAVGVMLYQALTGKLPFSGTRKEVRRIKQSIDPCAPANVVCGVPEDLNQLCIDLLNRDPDARPSGAEILRRLSSTEDGQESLDDGGDLAQATPFVGRDTELAELRRGFDAMLEGNTVVYQVSGRSGVGKSTLIENFLEDPSLNNDTVILRGRCYEQESIPFKGIDSLIDGLSHLLLGLPKAEVERLLPRDVAALSRIFPVLNRVPTLAARNDSSSEFLDLQELRRRGFAAMKEILFRIRERWPLVVYIDDLQWGDSDSASLLAEVMQPPDAPRWLLLACYRSEYQATSACLKALANAALPGPPRPSRFVGTELPRESPNVSSEPGWTMRKLEIGPLSASETKQLTRMLLADAGLDAPPQVEWIIDASEGSPYFIYELCQHLKTGKELTTVKGAPLDDVLWMRIERLPEVPRRLLEVIAVAGQPISLRNIQHAAKLASLPPHEVNALRSNHLVRSAGPDLDDEIETYHDRIRECVVANLPSEARKTHHGALAVTLEAGKADPETIAAHFEGAEQPEKASTYYLAAADDAVHQLAFERAEEFYQHAVSLAQSSEAKVNVQERLIHFYTDLARFRDAYAVGRQAVEAFGVTLPQDFRPLPFLVDQLRAWQLLRNRKIAEIVDLPTMSDKQLTSAIRLMAAVGKSAYQLRPELCIAVLVKMVNLCLQHGNTPDCAIGFMAFGAIYRGGIRGNRQAGYDFGRLALALVDKFDNDQQRAEVNHVVAYFATSWLRPATEAEALWRVAYDAGLRTEDLFHTGCACAGMIMSYHMRGVPLGQILEESQRFNQFLEPAQLREPIGCLTAVRQTIRNLRGQTRDSSSFHDDYFNENDYVAGLRDYGSRHFAHYYFIAKMQALYLWGKNDAAVEIAKKSARYLPDSAGTLHSVEHYFYEALVLAALSPDTSSLRRRRWLRSVRKAKVMLDQCADHCPDNFSHKRHVVAAEASRIAGQEVEATRHYDLAIDEASEYGYLQIEALANALAARHHAARDHSKAGSYLNRACDGYRRWGADAYADWLDHRGI